MAGWANSWVIELGGVLDDTMTSEAMVNAIGTVKKTDKDSKAAKRLLVLNLDHYDFSGMQAHVELTAEVKSRGKRIFKKSYTKKGKSQGGKMFWGGAAAMKNAVQQSTKSALDQVFAELITDVSKKR